MPERGRGPYKIERIAHLAHLKVLYQSSGKKNKGVGFLLLSHQLFSYMSGKISIMQFEFKNFINSFKVPIKKIVDSSLLPVENDANDICLPVHWILALSILRCDLSCFDLQF